MADGAPTATKTGAKSGARSSARKRRKPAGEALGTDAREATA
ncbi:MAG: hypothetical protein FD124_2664, partial [Alphaproteobacteria bacterium]